MFARLLVVLVLCACDSAAPDLRGTLGNAVQLDVRVDGLSEELAQIHGLSALPIRIEGTSPADASVHTDLSVGANQALIVVPSRGDPITYQGAPLRAEYYHHGRLLTVYQGTGDVLVIHSFVEPVRWYTVLRTSL
ncbi:hypothetical protein [Nannocystis radixulma]|uniref:Lipoprotein n=1 Tax=Nannocystis radixulma TaxID=2995305 RepID=A0ABT5B645_9BACT|nr:hypothetical protein [Nannocystis radixulma]MDC0668933.1 hypothetical protein [Nannocystis radixulma]